jgi:hypothetical protein
MATPTRFFRKRIHRASQGRVAWHLVRRGQWRIALQALEALYRRG